MLITWLMARHPGQYSKKNEQQQMFVLGKAGTSREMSLDDAIGQRRAALLKLSRREGLDGADTLWEGVCRRWLMKGE